MDFNNTSKMSVNNNSGNYIRLRNKKPKVGVISAKKERNLSIKKVSIILQKDEAMRTKEEKDLLFNYSEIVKEAARRIERRRQLKERLQEIEDSESVLDEKCKQLAEAILKSENLVVYTGAGISTAARIPDYRGASGIWTLLQQGKDIGNHDLTQADPTFTHMALFQLYLQGKLKHVVSQNCDGLHLRSGLPRKVLSEVHGNMYIEVCKSCRPIIEYLRLFDVTENTGRYSHRTMRKCYKCNSSLVDSIVHFGERGNLPWPLNWKGACRAAEKADMILCIGSSLKVLKRYPWLWSMDKPIKRRPHIYIVNLQWTPKDCQATIKINGKCDAVMEKLMKYLAINVPSYSREFDPVFEHATELCKEELHTKNRPFLSALKEEKFQVKLESKIGIKSEEECVWEKMEEDIKNDVKESCVTSCKKEVLIDTGQGEDVKCIRKELILITIRSGEDFQDCCDLFKVNQMHGCECPNFIDEGNDIPVIMQDDQLLVKQNGSQFGQGEKSTTNGLNETKDTQFDLTTEKFDELKCNVTENSNQQYLHSRNIIINSYKTARAEEISESGNKRSKLNEESNLEKNNKMGKGVESVCSSVLEIDCGKKTSNGCNSREKVGGGGAGGGGIGKCSYCWKQYSSSSCLFYVKRKAIFKSNVPVCDCCSSDENDEESPSEEKINEPQMKTNPGWYGKGLRKSIKKKR